MKSENWNKYSEVKIRNTLPLDLPIKTEKQWNKSGYVKASEDVGHFMRPNMLSTGAEDLKLYLFPDEVRKATKEELYKIREPQRIAREKYIKRQKEEAEEKERYFDCLTQENERLSYQNKKLMQEIIKLKGIIPTKTIVIDTETTGLAWYDDEILQLSIIDDSGNILINELFKPLNHTSWYEAQSVNGISPEMVADKPTIQEKIIDIQEIISSASIIIGYNTEFDINFLTSTGIFVSKVTKYVDVMCEYATVYGKYSEKYGCNKWCKLIEAAEHYGYKFKAHDSLEDCKATLHVYNKMREEGFI